MKKWLGGHIEQDTTCAYSPPQGQKEEIETSDADAKPVEEDDNIRLTGDFLPTELYWTGSLPGYVNEDSFNYQAQHLIETCPDLYEVHQNQRGMLYRYFRKKLVQKVMARMPKLLRQYGEVVSESKTRMATNNAWMLQQERFQIIGCTTTGLSKYRELLLALKPRILMIEEAAETREANITSALFPSLEQLVLVGDHQQLRPHVDVRELLQFGFGISLLERLVDLGVPYSMLRVQRRMIPSIREVVHTFYPRLEDHPMVKDPSKRPPVPGMGGINNWWFNHSWPEDQNDQISKSNMTEARMIVQFTAYLVQNGTLPNKITILSFYRGQIALIQKLLKAQRHLLLGLVPENFQWSVQTIDGFQGEENDVIILSVVRSRRGQAAAGFVANENRAVVAMSRARCGFYVFGDALNLLKSGPEGASTWAKVVQVFDDQEKLADYRLPLTCQTHGTITNMSEPDRWEAVRDGGCDEPCQGKLPCGHDCGRMCHPTDHAKLACRKPCEEVLGCGHACIKSCGDKCRCARECDKKTFTLPRGQQQTSTVRNPSRQPSGPGDRAQGWSQNRGGRGDRENRGDHASRGGRGGRENRGDHESRGGRGGGDSRGSRRDRGDRRNVSVREGRGGRGRGGRQQQDRDEAQLLEQEQARVMDSVINSRLPSERWETFRRTSRLDIESASVRPRSNHEAGMDRANGLLIDFSVTTSNVDTRDVEEESGGSTLPTSRNHESSAQTWSTAAFARNDAEARAAREEELQKKTAVTAVTIRETFRPTFADGNGNRRQQTGNAARSEHVIPTPGSYGASRRRPVDNVQPRPEPEVQEEKEENNSTDKEDGEELIEF